jgi:photosystem II stability/assembly factor-like uncharacterized protein
MKKFILIFTALFLTTGFIYSQDGPNTWTNNSGNIGRIYAMAVDPANNNNVYAGGLDSGMFKSTNGGANWFAINSGLTYNHVQSLAISASNPSILYCGTDTLGSQNGVYKTTNGGANWVYMSATQQDSKGIQAILVHPTNPNIVYIAVYNAVQNANVGILKSTDGGTTWNASGNGLVVKNILSLAMNPKNPNVLYAGTSFDPVLATGPSKIYRSNDAGANWTEMSGGLPTASTSNNPCRAICISSADTAVALAVFFCNPNDFANGGCWFTTNGGANWVQRNTGLTIASATLFRSCAVRPNSAQEFYVGIDAASNAGVWRTTNQGLTWTDFNNGAMLNTYAVRSIVFKTAGNLTVFAGGAAAATLLAGRGVFEYTYTLVSVTNNERPERFSLSQNYPNPFNPATTINYQIAKAGNVSLIIYDALGREAAVLVNEQVQPGSYNVTFDASNFPSGSYTYKLVSGSYTETKRMMLVK